ncbi:MAG TPA: SPOR domain-containing protein [Bacteroidales bacterium]|mgnify:FL=1|nr:SPOR domain-containing protein [Bacteroidales bacterium]
MKHLQFSIKYFLVCVIFFPFYVSAQKINPADYNTLSAGIKLGVLPFYGDIKQYKPDVENRYHKTDFGFALEGIKNYNEKFGLRANLMFASLSGSSPNLNLYFRNKLKELSLSGLVNINNLLSIYTKKERFINVYMFAGLGIVNFRSKLNNYTDDTFVNAVGWDSLGNNKTSSKTDFVFPLGMGVKFKVDPKIDIGMEYTLHLTNTDKLDAQMVSNSYMDRYSYIAVSITYKIGNKKEYVDWINPLQDTSKTVFIPKEELAQTTVISKKEEVVKEENEVKNAEPNIQKEEKITTEEKISTTTQKTKNTQATEEKTKKETATPAKTTTKTSTPNKTTKEDKEKPFVEETKSPLKEKPVQQVKSKTAKTEAVIDKKYYVVSASFKSKSQAKEMVNKLIEKGFTDAVLLGKNSSGSYMVSTKGFDIIEEAVGDYTITKKTYSSTKLVERKGKDFVNVSGKTISTIQNSNGVKPKEVVEVKPIPEPEKQIIVKDDSLKMETPISFQLNKIDDDNKGVTNKLSNIEEQENKTEQVKKETPTVAISQPITNEKSTTVINQNNKTTPPVTTKPISENKAVNVKPETTLVKKDSVKKSPAVPSTPVITIVKNDTSKKQGVNTGTTPIVKTSPPVKTQTSVAKTEITKPATTISKDTNKTIKPTVATKVDTLKKTTKAVTQQKPMTITGVVSPAANQPGNVTYTKPTVEKEKPKVDTIIKVVTETVVVNFFIIAASYSTENEAKTAVSELISKGFKDASIAGKDENGVYLVSYKSFSTKSEASTQLSVIKRLVNPSAWIFEKP